MSADRPRDPGSAKQKIMLVIVIIVCLIVAWQVYSLFGGGSSSSSEPTPAPAANNATPAANTSPGGAAATPAMTQQPLTQARSDTFSQNNELLRIAKQNEPKYIAALTELEMLKLELEIAQTNQSITNAKLGTVTTEQNIADLLTKATAPTPSANPGAEGGSPFSSAMLGANGQSRVPGYDSASGVPDQNAAPKPSFPKREVTTLISNYNVAAIRYQNDKWHAVLSLGNTLLPVSVGDTLPDQSLVVGIDKNGVTLKRGAARQVLAMTNRI